MHYGLAFLLLLKKIILSLPINHCISISKVVEVLPPFLNTTSLFSKKQNTWLGLSKTSLIFICRLVLEITLQPLYKHINPHSCNMQLCWYSYHGTDGIVRVCEFLAIVIDLFGNLFSTWKYRGCGILLNKFKAKLLSFLSVFHLTIYFWGHWYSLCMAAC